MKSLQKMERFNPFDKIYQNNEYEVNFGFNTKSCRWMYIISNLIEINEPTLKKKGIPHIIYKVEELNPCYLIKDAANLYELLKDEKSKNHHIPSYFIYLFLKCFRNILSLTDKILLNPELILIEEENVIFLGMPSDKVNFSDSPSLMSWMAYFFTYDDSFLNSKKPWEIVQRNQGRIPLNWRNSNFWKQSLADQYNFIIHYLKILKSPNILGYNQKVNFWKDYSPIYNDWGMFQSFAILNSHNFENCDTKIKVIIKNILKWKFKDLLKSFNRLYYNLPDLDWYWQILKVIDDLSLFKRAINAISIICLSSLKKIQDISQLQEMIENFIENLQNHPMLKKNEIDFSLEFDVDKLLKLTPIERNSILPIILISQNFQFELGQKKAHGILFFLNIIIELLQKGTNNPIDRDLWQILMEIMVYLDDDDTDPSIWAKIRDVMREIHLEIKSNPIKNKLFLSEFLGNLFISQKWIFRPEVFSIAGEIYDLLIKNQMKHLPKNQSPYFDLVKVFITQHASTTDNQWKSYLHSWLEIYKKHFLREVVKQSFKEVLD